MDAANGEPCPFAVRLDAVAVDPHQATRFAGCGLQVLEEAGVANLGWTPEAVAAAVDLHRWAVFPTASVPDTPRFDHYLDF